MGMGVKTDKLRSVVLAILVLLSFLFSYYLWTAGRGMGEEEMTSGTTSQSNVSITTHTESDTFRPTIVALHGTDNQDQIQIGRTYPLRNLLSDMFETQDLNQIDRSIITNYEEYINEMEQGRWLEFVYSEAHPLGLIDQKFEEISRDMSQNFYDRVSINIDNPTSVYFYHTESQTMHVASTSGGEDLAIEPFLSEENIDYTGAYPVFLNNNIVYLPTDPVNIPNRRYVIEQLPNGVYINNFFPDTSLMDRRSNSNITRFIDLTKEVSINQNIYTLNYLRQISDTGDLEPTTRFERSFNQVNRFENWSDTFVVSNYDETEEIIEFQREIDGYPVFSLNGYETISEVGLVETGVTHLKLPLRFINTPIDIQGAPEKKLMSGEELWTRLEEGTPGNVYNRIEDLSIGYSWDQSEEDNQVVNFNPDWFVLVDGDWMIWEDYLELDKEATNGL